MIGLDSTWWLTPFLLLVWSFILAAFLVAWWPRAMNGPVSARERRGRAAPRRTMLTLVGPLLAGIGAILVTVAPRWPTIVLLDASAPDEVSCITSEHRLEDACNRVLARAQAEVGETWLGRTPEQCKRLRELIWEELSGSGPLKVTPSAASATQPLPLWVVESVRLSLVDGAMTRTGAERSIVGRSEPRAAWERLRRIRSPGRDVAFGGATPQTGPSDAEIAALFDAGFDPASRSLSARGLIRGTPGTHSVHRLAVQAGTRTIHWITLPHHQVHAVDLVPMSQILPDSVALAGILKLFDASGTVWTTVAIRGEKLEVPVVGIGAADLVATVNGVLDSDGLGDRLVRRGLPPMKFVARAAGPDDVSLRIDTGTLLVLAARAEGPVPDPLQEPAPPPMTVTVGGPFARRVTRTDEARTVDSLAGIALAVPANKLLARTAAPARPLVSGVHFCQEFDLGRWVIDPAEVGRFDMLDTGSTQTGRFRRLLLDMEEQGMIGATGRFEPLRAQALVAEIVRAVAALGSYAIADEDAEVAPAVLITDHAHHRLDDLGRRPTRAIGMLLAAIGLALLWISQRTARG